MDSQKNEAAFVEAAKKWVGDDAEEKAMLEKLNTNAYMKVLLLEKYGYAAYQGDILPPPTLRLEAGASRSSTATRTAGAR